MELTSASILVMSYIILLEVLALVSTLFLSNSTISANHVINSAGLYADKVAHKFDFGHKYRMLPFKGLYWYAPNQTNKLTRHIYPIPDARNPFLGVHLTVTDEGKVKVGPTAKMHRYTR